MNARRLISAILVALAGSLALASAPAFAGKIYFPGVSFGGPCVITVQERCEGKFDEPIGVAVNDETKDVYVVDKGNKRVEEFTAEGAFIKEFAPPGGFADPEQIAVDNSGDSMADPSAGDVYVTDMGHGAIDKFSATGTYEGKLTETEYCEQPEYPPCSGSKIVIAPFTELHGVAVDPSGNLWVYGGTESEYGGGYVDEFSDEGSFVQWFRTLAAPHSNHGLAVESNGDVYVGVGVYMEVERLTAAGERLVTVGHRGAFALAVVPPTSTLLAGELLQDTGGAIARYTPINEGEQKPLETFPGEDVPNGYEGLSGSYGLAVNASATVYASEAGADKVESFNYVSVPGVITEAPSDVTETGLTLHGSVNPEGEEVKECYFEYGTEVGKYTHRIGCQPPAGKGAGHIGEGTAAAPVSAVLSGLEPAEVRSFRLVAVSGSGVPGVGKGLTVTRPLITGVAASGVGSTSATLNAEVDPAGLETCYRIEYGTSGAYGGNVAGECVGAGEEEVKVSREVSGLRSGVAYHFRIVASNALGTKTGEDIVVTTFPAGEGELPDGRVYELVGGGPSGGAGHDGNVYVPGSAQMLAKGLDKGQGSLKHGISSERLTQAAADGEAVAYVGDPPVTGGNGAAGPDQGSQYVARRSAGGGWSQTPVSPPGFANEYAAFSSELSVGVLHTAEQLAEDAPAGYDEIYSRALTGGPFEALFTVAPAGRTPKEFGYLDGRDQFQNNQLDFAGGNAGTGVVPAFSHLLFEASAVLPSTPNAPEGGSGANNLYESVGGQLYLVNVLPNGQAKPGATFGLQEGLEKTGDEGRDTGNVISADGSRVYWSEAEWVPVGKEVEERAKRLYLRENAAQPQSPIEEGECAVQADACTVQVDAAEPGMGSGGGGQFVAANSDGSRVFFTDEKRLTSDSLAQPGEPDLYEYDTGRPEEERLSDLSAPAKAGSRADLQGVLGTSQDGSYVYFVADGVLTEGGNAEGKEPEQGQPNVYVRHGGATAFVVTLGVEEGDFTPGSGGEFHVGDWQGDPGRRTAEVAPDGRGAVFMSRLPLTGYDNVLDGVHLTEVFVYDAETGRLACASCNPSGEPPVAPALPEYADNIQGIWGSFMPVSDSMDDYQPRVISEGGSRVFFDSIEPLVPRDSNGYLDVYEWERDGVGSCEQERGCVYLLSGGQDPENSYFVDASASGDDVFFVSRAQLVSEDRGGEAEVLYDARVGGVAPPAGSSCSGTGCQGVPPAAPIFATPASATFAGTGNFPPPAVVVRKTTKKKTVKCAKGEKSGKHGRCTKSKKRSGKQSRAKFRAKSGAKGSSRQLRGER